MSEQSLLYLSFELLISSWISKLDVGKKKSVLL